MLKKLLETSLFGLLLFSLNASAESVRIEIKADEKGVRIQVEVPGQGVINEMMFENDSSPSSDKWPKVKDPNGDYSRRDRMPVGGLPVSDRHALQQSWARYPGSVACGDDPDCKARCFAGYFENVKRFYKARCLEFPIPQVEALKEIERVLTKTGTKAALEKIDLFDLAVFGTLIKFEKLFHHLSGSVKKKILVWVAENEDVTDYFAEEEDDYEILKALFSGWHDNWSVAFSTFIIGSENFVKIALSEGNGSALDWVHGFFEGNVCLIQNEDLVDPVCVLKRLYCSQRLTEDQWNDLFSYEHVEELIDQILEEFTTETPPEWWVEGVDSSSMPVSEEGSLCLMNLVNKEKAGG